MTRRDPESWLWELSRLPKDGAPPEPTNAELTDETLLAYREGRLGPDEARRVERILPASPARRARLLALAGVGKRALRPGLREKVLASAGRRARFPWRLAAALATVTLGAGLLWTALTGGPRELSRTLPALEGGIAALAEVRAGVELFASASAYPSTPVRIALAVPSEPVPGLEFALYRFEGARLERIEPPALEARIGRGAVELTGRASDLVGSAPGRYALLAAMSWQGQLPRRLTADSELGARSALERAGARVVALELHLLPTPEVESSDVSNEETQP